MKPYGPFYVYVGVLTKNKAGRIKQNKPATDLNPEWASHRHLVEFGRPLQTKAITDEHIRNIQVLLRFWWASGAACTWTNIKRNTVFGIVGGSCSGAGKRPQIRGQKFVPPTVGGQFFGPTSGYQKRRPEWDHLITQISNCQLESHVTTKTTPV